MKARMEEDVEALKRVTAKGLPDIRQTERLLRQRSTRRLTWKEELMETLRDRPWMAPAAGAVIVVLVLLLVPFSYARLAGYEVRVNLAASPAQAGLVASQLCQALQTSGVRMTAGERGLELAVRVPRRSRSQVESTAQAFARALTARGLAATAEVQPVMERALGSVCAMAADRVTEIRVNRKGKTSAQLEQEIRRQLDAAGLSDMSVSVKGGAGETQVLLKSTSPKGSAEGAPRVRLHIEGDEPAPGKGKKVQVEVQRKPGMTDEQVKAEVLRQLERQGTQADVQVVNGQISIRPRKK